MLQLLPNNQVLKVEAQERSVVVQYLSDYIDKYHCKNLEVDLSSINTIDASYISALCSAKHYTKYPDGKIMWKVTSELVNYINKDLQLGNSTYIL